METQSTESENQGIAAKLPASTIVLNLHLGLSSILLSFHGPPLREIARDGLLRNFPWPDELNVAFDF